MLPSNLALVRDPQAIHVQLGGNDSQQLLLSRRPTTKKCISSIHDWVLAFSAYAAVIITADPARGPDLFEYTRIIVQAEREYKGDAWLCYDTAFAHGLLIATSSAGRKSTVPCGTGPFLVCAELLLIAPFALTPLTQRLSALYIPRGQHHAALHHLLAPANPAAPTPPPQSTDPYVSTGIGEYATFQTAAELISVLPRVAEGITASPNAQIAVTLLVRQGTLQTNPASQSPATAHWIPPPPPSPINISALMSELALHPNKAMVLF